MTGPHAQCVEDIMRLAAERDVLKKALERIEAWEFPETGTFWDKEKTRPMSYGAAYGSNGERDYMRGIAREALRAYKEDK